MNCERVQGLSTDYVTGELSEDLKAQIEAHLAGCAACSEEIRGSQAVWTGLGSLPTVKPGPAMDARFSEMLAHETRGLDPARREQPASSPLKILACWLETLWPRRPALQFGLALVLFGLGLLVSPTLAAFRTQAQPSAGNDRALAQLQEDVAGLKRMVAVSLLQQQSSSERLRGVEWSQQLAAPDDQVLGALLVALNSDPSVNVRLAAVEALQQFATRTAVREGLLAALPRQTSPVVQIELVQLLVELKEKNSVPLLKALLQDSQTNPTVRQRVEWGLEQLT